MPELLNLEPRMAGHEPVEPTTEFTGQAETLHYRANCFISDTYISVYCTTSTKA